MSKKFSIIHKTTRRAFILYSMKILCIGGIFGRIYYLQNVQGKKYKLLSRQNSVSIIVNPAERGQIYDRNQNILAKNVTIQNIVFRKYYNITSDEIESELRLFTQIMGKHLDKSYDNLLLAVTNQKVRYINLLENANWQSVETFVYHAHKFQYIEYQPLFQRYYPYGEIIAQFIGITSRVNELDKLRQNKLYQHMNYRIGVSGAEKFFHARLEGKPEIQEIETNAHGHHIRLLNSIPAKKGENIVTSIDIELQKYCYNQMKEYIGAVTLIDIATGEVLAMTSNPSFDNNIFMHPISQDTWNKVNNSETKPMVNRAIAHLYPPASTFKTIVSIAGLEKKLIKENLIVNCNGSITINGMTFRCWKHHGHGKINLTQAIEQSCNVYFYQISQIIGIDNLSQMARLFGFGETFGIDFPTQTQGIRPSRLWKMNNLQADWFVGDTINVSIGQGYTSCNTLQLATMIARIASGRMIIPQFIRAPQDSLLKEAPLLFNGEFKNLEIVRNALFQVINSRQGTAYRARISSLPGIEVAGKTGTSQVQSSRNEELYDISQPHGMFVGYIPYRNPKFAISIVLEHIGNSLPAVKIANDILHYVYGKNVA